MSYQVRYQLGGKGENHRSLRQAIRDLIQARNLAKENCDQQAIFLDGLSCSEYENLERSLAETKGKSIAVRIKEATDAITKGEIKCPK